ncbi:monovalent cation/H+ antiporter subunit D [Devosia limi DSM 17137]|uniref:Monovalent cation/H+ antiporter subunit D n=1 Tax=Devosia limi DSM 17137 TaxID=1121477 RepID=A0A0F5LXW3_9HYPH|nr:monovalent cation/H+ antiporter subunit D [Devosia limi]KKB86497.1 monovalent cation/H+ antiporter subunit D [Devosia limi DSM 17137]SHE86564.1 multisubunit potassium/proton antiporter, PhaD subunit (TC 2.A.63.1.1) [Devosia limi DSM 17137]
MGGLLDHLVILPIVLPMAAGAIMLFFDDRLRTAKAIINFGATALLVVFAVLLVIKAAGVDATTGATATYPLGNWPVPFGIVLVADRLAAMMVLLTAVLGICALVYSLARWHAAGPSFHSLFQFLLMGLNGAFLTGDLFNLFVFFEVMLAASYGLALHGTGLTRVKAGLHYVAVNLAASSLFLIGAALIYGVAGTLNMADLAARVPLIAASDRGLLEAGAAILGVAFLVKAGMWPLGFWLPTTYAAASAPVAALFAIMTKVGVYAVLRLSLLIFGEGSGASAGFGHDFLLYGGMATIAFGAVGVLASQSTARLAGYCVLVSSGTLLAATAFGNVGVTAGALFYLVSSTLAISAFFLLVELLERIRIEGADVLAVTMEAYGEEDEEMDEVEDVGVVIPGALAVLSISFGICVLLLAGLPPLSGFLAKFTMLSAMLNPDGLIEAGAVVASTWWLIGLLIFSGFAALIALTRTGINTFWMTMSDRPAPVRVIEIAPVLVLLGLCIAMSVMAGPVMGYMDEAAAALHMPAGYIADVLNAPLVVEVVSP